MDQNDVISRRTLRMPQDAADFIEREAKRNFTSANAEVVRAVRERMERTTTTAGGKFGDRTPAVAPNADALHGSASTTA